MEKLKLRQFTILFLIILLSSILLGFYLKNIELTESIDYKIMNKIQSNNFFTKNSILLNLTKLITSLGNGISCILLLFPLGLYFYYQDSKKDFIFLVITLLLTFFLNELIKHIVLRKRPVDFFVINMGGFSYPSGHSMNVSAFYLTFRFLLSKKIKSKFINIFIIILIISIAISRVILGVHWLTDVIVGLILGYFCYNLAKLLYLNFWRG